jgi:hypothetical protein
VLSVGAQSVSRVGQSWRQASSFSHWLRNREATGMPSLRRRKSSADAGGKVAMSRVSTAYSSHGYKGSPASAACRLASVPCAAACRARIGVRSSAAAGRQNPPSRPAPRRAGSGAAGGTCASGVGAWAVPAVDGGARLHARDKSRCAIEAAGSPYQPRPVPPA